MRVEVIGSRGQLGRQLVEALAKSLHQVTGHSREDLDISDKHAIDVVLGEVEPDVVVNCAAWTKVDAAEVEPELAWTANAIGPRHLAEVCRDRGVLLCHISTDYVFDGTATAPLDELATPNPQGVYARSKFAGEEAVRASWARHQIVRTSWLYGMDGPNFVLTMLRVARAQGWLRVVADQHGSPTWTGHLAPAIIRLVERDEPGTYHLSASGTTTWHGFASAIVAQASLAVPVEAITTAEYPTPAPRPAYSVLDNARWRGIGETPLPHWREGLREYLLTRGFPPGPSAMVRSARKGS